MSFEGKTLGAPIARAEEVGLQENGYGTFAVDVGGVVQFVVQRGEYVYLLPRMDQPTDARNEIS